MAEDKEARLAEIHKRVAGVVNREVSHDQVQDKYVYWAVKYEDDMAYWGYKAPQVAVSEVNSFLKGNKQAKILDVCAGTGLIGQALNKAGYTDIDYHDPNDSMKLEAIKKDVYHGKFFTTYLGHEKIDSPDNVYDAITLVGALCDGHVNETCFGCFREFARVLKPGGVFYGGIVSDCLKDQYKANIEKSLNDLVKEGVFTWVHEGTRYVPDGDYKEATWTLRAC